MNSDQPVRITGIRSVPQSAVYSSKYNMPYSVKYHILVSEFFSLHFHVTGTWFWNYSYITAVHCVAICITVTVDPPSLLWSLLKFIMLFLQIKYGIQLFLLCPGNVCPEYISLLLSYASCAPWKQLSSKSVKTYGNRQIILFLVWLLQKLTINIIVPVFTVW